MTYTTTNLSHPQMYELRAVMANILHDAIDSCAPMLKQLVFDPKTELLQDSSGYDATIKYRVYNSCGGDDVFSHRIEMLTSQAVLRNTFDPTPVVSVYLPSEGLCAGIVKNQRMQAAIRKELGKVDSVEPWVGSDMRLNELPNLKVKFFEALTVLDVTLHHLSCAFSYLDGINAFFERMGFSLSQESAIELLKTDWGFRISGYIALPENRKRSVAHFDAKMLLDGRHEFVFKPFSSLLEFADVAIDYPALVNSAIATESLREEICSRLNKTRLPRFVTDFLQP